MNIEHIGVIGAGQMGAGIAQVAAQAGFDVSLMDVNESLALAARSRIDGALAAQVKKGKLEERAWRDTISRIRVIDRFAQLDGAQLIIEAAVEDVAIKCDVFQRAEAVVGTTRWVRSSSPT